MAKSLPITRTSLEKYIGKEINVRSYYTLEERAKGFPEYDEVGGIAEDIYEEYGYVWMLFDWGYATRIDSRSVIPLE